MPKLIVVEKPETWKFSLDDVEVITPDQYISNEIYQEGKNLKVLNLCKSYQYQSEGYYVSLLAEARGHKVLPGVSTIQDFRFPSILRDDSLDFDALIQNTFKGEPYDRIEFNIYFGITQSETLNKLGLQLFQLVQAPSVRAAFSKKNKWVLQSIRPISLSEVPENDKPLLISALEKYFFLMPRFLRRLIWFFIRRDPYKFKQLAGTVGVTSMGMFASGAAVVQPITPMTLTLSIGAIERKAIMKDGVPIDRAFIHLNLGADHDIIDGAPLMRFADALGGKLRE